MTVLVGGVGELYQGDLDLGRHAAEILAAGPLPHDVVVEDLHYGAVGVVHRLRDLNPTTLVLVGATPRGRPPGTLERERVQPPQMTTAEAQAAVGDAVTGYVGIDLVVQVAHGLGHLPPRTVTVDVEPAETGPSDQLSEVGQAALRRAVAVVRTELQRTPLLELADVLRELVAGDRLERTPAVEAMCDLLDQLDGLDRHASWGTAFRERDRLRMRIAEGLTGHGMDHLDWGLWWTMIEELDRLQQLEAVDEPA
jgi:hydrogenase maturation protease